MADVEVAELEVTDLVERVDLGEFTGRLVRLDAAAMVRLRCRDGRVDAWAQTPFDALVTRSVHGDLAPPDLTVAGSDLLAALTVQRARRVDPGRALDARWRGALPPAQGWLPLEEVPVAELEALSDRGISLAGRNPGRRGAPSSALLDQPALTVSGSRCSVEVPMRCLFALAGMGLIGQGGGERGGGTVRVSVTDSWLRLDTPRGAVVRRRRALLPLLV